MTNDDLFAILDSVQSDDEHDMDNLLNDSDTEYECVTQDTEDYVKAESSVIQEKVLEAVIHILSSNPGDNDCDFVVNKEGTEVSYHIEFSRCRPNGINIIL